MTKEQRAAATARMRRYRAEAAKDQKTLDVFHAKQRAWNRAWRAMKAQDPIWLAAHRAKERARMKAYYAAHPEKKREQWHRFTEKYGVARRPVARMAYAKKVVLAGKPYAPRFYLRKPDYVPVGESGLDTRSPWLINNLTDSQRAYARELAIERKAQREA